MDPQNINTEQTNAELQKMAETLRQARSEMEQFGVVSAETAKALAEIQKESKFNEMWGRKWSIAAGAATSAASSLGSSLYKGQTGASAAAGALSEFTTTIGDAVSTLALLHPGGWIKKGLMFLGGQGLKLLGKYVKETAKVSDDVYDAFFRLNNAGMTTAGGMERFAANVINLGYGIEELDKAVELFKNNAEVLARFGGTAADGAQRMSEFIGRLRTTDQVTNRTLRRFLKDNDGVAKRFAVYADQQSILGNQTRVTVQGFKDMVMASDALTKAFGIQTEQLDAAIKNQNRETRLRLLREQLIKQKGEEEGNAIYNDMIRQIGAVEASDTLGPEVAELVKALATGERDTQKSREAFLLLSQAGIDATLIRERLLNREIEIVDVVKMIGQGAKSAANNFGDLSRSQKIFEDAFGKAAPALNAASNDYVESLRKARVQTDDQSKGIGRSAEAQLGARIANEKTRSVMQDFVLRGVDPATGALRIFSETLNGITGQRGQVNDNPLAGLASRVGEALGLPPPTGLGRRGADGSTVPVMPTAPMTGPGGAAEPGAAAANLAAVRELIGRAESRGDYNVMVGGKKADLTNMTLEQILDLQKTMGRKNGFESDALGKYQITSATLRDLIRKTGLDPKTTKFDEAMQDRLADELIVYRGQYNKYAAGAISKDKFLKNLSTIWAGLPKDSSGKSYYDKVGSNKATVSYEDAIKSFKVGGISKGPDSGYLAMLHGMEAIVPLNNNRKIPVEFKDMDRGNWAADMSFSRDFVNINESINRQSQVLEQQLQKSEAMIQALNRFASGDQMTIMIDKLQNINDKMNTSNDINSKILQVQM